jgi:uncharacterized glyoxalase superfamily protein PhnB
MTTATQSIFPSVRYRDAVAAIDFLERAFGFEPGLVVQDHDGAVQHAELRFAGEWIMVGSTTEGGDGRLAVDTGPAWIYLVVDDPDAHYERARAAGAEIVRELIDEEFGSRGYTARDPEGNLWSVGTYRPDDEEEELGTLR